MAKHKAATEITIVQEERSAFADFVDRYKWHGVGALVAVSAVVLWLQRSSAAAVQEERADWGALYAAETSETEPAEALADAIKNIDDPAVAAWANVKKAAFEAGDRSFEAAIASLSSAERAGSPLLTELTFPVGPDGEESTLYKAMIDRLQAEGEFHASNPHIYTNPELPEDAPRVQFETDRGTILVGLYVNEAPQHVKNMLKLVESGFYKDTLFHRVNEGAFIQGGDPNTKDGGDEATWGTGGPGYTVPQEKNALKHTAGALAAAKPGGATDSSGSQFYITAKPMHRQFDGGYVVFGTVIDGLEVVEEISMDPTKEDDPERPVSPVKILDARVLE